jgi:hypothetical protein
MKEQRMKQKIKGRYEQIALVRNSSEACCAPAECCGGGDRDSTGNIIHGRKSSQLRKKN